MADGEAERELIVGLLLGKEHFWGRGGLARMAPGAADPQPQP